uniref:Uncharacterized protein n=1 Tax=Cryptomonas curvata TaxID=233186 RepID=A0A7S0N0F4_9CRYP|mmetsp:Transcript_58884/g.123004  ORF Transcript_58884/g.123004 Transcript_58884/m.123004 type:complete len:113 (+) Transcript_58884:47-385(+)
MSLGMQGPQAMEADLANISPERLQGDPRLQDRRDVVIDIMDDFSLSRCDFPPCFEMEHGSRFQANSSVSAVPALFDGLKDFIHHQFTSCKEYGSLKHASPPSNTKSGCSHVV